MDKRRSRLAAQLVRDEEENVKLGAPRQVDPGVALLEEIHRSAGHVAWLEAKVRDLEESELVWSKVMESFEEKEGGGPTGDYTIKHKENRAEINVWWKLYERERAHLAQVSVAALRAGVEERRVRLAERGVDLLEAAVNGALTDLGLDPNDPQVRRVVGTRLREALQANVFGVPDASESAEPRMIVNALPAGERESAEKTRW